MREKSVILAGEAYRKIGVRDRHIMLHAGSAVTYGCARTSNGVFAKAKARTVVAGHSRSIRRNVDSLARTTDLRSRRAPFWWCRQPCRQRPAPCYAQMPPSSSSPW
eukprot:COSAG01_NODE_228_length_21104_cov_210.303832_2_plen_106_part_00